MLMRRGRGAPFGAILMCGGIVLLGCAVLPAVCWLFVIGLAMVLKGYSMIKERGR
jgi:heme O synthase-like polyprenyltransferase